MPTRRTVASAARAGRTSRALAYLRIFGLERLPARPATRLPRATTVFTYFGTPLSGSPDPTTVSEYARLATDTGGQAFTAPVANVGGFQAVLQNIICASGGEACQMVEEPRVVPCVRLRWGDGPNDRIETDDAKILCITVCNPYNNVTLRDFTLHLAVLGPGGAVPTLPDGTPSVQVRPDYMICFGDVLPCDPKRPDQPSCVSREVVLISRGAQEGPYTVFSAYCFQACFTEFGFGEAFKLDLVKS
jgi:hypothetical protein